MLTYKRTLSLSTLRSKESFTIFDFLPPADSHFMTGSVRNGLEAIIGELGMTNKDTVLLPAFVAQGVISPFQKKNINIAFYKCNADLKFDAEDIKKKISGNKAVKCIVIIHYFGFPQYIEELKSFCAENNVVLFEDCAQALFSKDANGKLLGSTGDISFFSLPKSLPVPDGAVFIVNNDKYKYITEKIKSSYGFSINHKLAVFFHFWFLLIKNIETKFNYGIISRILNFKTSALYVIYYFFLRRINKPVKVSKLSLKILSKINYKDFIDKRKTNIALIYDRINRNRYQLMFRDHNSNYMLTGVPLLSKERNTIVKEFKKRKNIECLCYLRGWDFFPKGTHEFDSELEVFNTHYLLPIKENSDIQYMVNILSDK